MTDEKIRMCLLQNRIISKADTKNIDTCLDSASIHAESFAADEVIFSPASNKKCVGLILDGIAVASPASSGENAMLKLLCKGDMFGIANLYSESGAFPSVISAKTSAEILFIDGKAFKALLESDSGAMKEYLVFLNEKILYLNKKISTLTAGSTEKKLAVFLCENQSGGEFVSPISMSSISDMLNVGRASLYRAINALEAEGLIRKEGKRIIIPDKNALFKFV